MGCQCGCGFGHAVCRCGASRLSVLLFHLYQQYSDCLYSRQNHAHGQRVRIFPDPALCLGAGGLCFNDNQRFLPCHDGEKSDEKSLGGNCFLPCGRSPYRPFGLGNCSVYGCLRAALSDSLSVFLCLPPAKQENHRQGTFPCSFRSGRGNRRNAEAESVPSFYCPVHDGAALRSGRCKEECSLFGGDGSAHRPDPFRYEAVYERNAGEDGPCDER